MQILENVSLRPFNTFGFDVRARFLVHAASADELKEALAHARRHHLPLLVLGGGSNVLLRQDFPGLAVRVAMQGNAVVADRPDRLDVAVAAGENWHGFVMQCVAREHYGLENLSLIPGTVGAAPIQNIGAYGVEIADAFQELEAVAVDSGETVRFDAAACRFGYRDSVFKRELKDRFVITRVTFRLKKRPDFVLRHAALVRELEAGAPAELTIRRVSDAVCAIRRRNLPDPQALGNAGSFFMNPVVPEAVYQDIRASYPQAPGFPAGDGRVKLAAGWLIDQCGLKGRRSGDAGVFERNALVLVNHGHATGDDVLSLAAEVQARVRERFGVDIQPEPRVY